MTVLAISACGRDPTRPMMRLPRRARRVSLVPEARIRAMPESMAAIRDSARRMEAAMVGALGHAFGLEHSLDHDDVMYPEVFPWGLVDFTDAEWLTIRMMLQRRTGNLWPDDDTRVPASSAGTWTELIRCDGP